MKELKPALPGLTIYRGFKTHSAGLESSLSRRKMRVASRRKMGVASFFQTGTGNASECLDHLGAASGRTLTVLEQCGYVESGRIKEFSICFGPTNVDQTDARYRNSSF
jgi:hypothetical protein